MAKSKSTWSVMEIVDSIPNEQWKKERWYATDLGRCLGGVYYSRLGKAPTNPPDARGLRVIRMGKQMEKLLVDDIFNTLSKPVPAASIAKPGYVLARLKAVFWNKESFEEVKEILYDKEKTVIAKFYESIEYFVEGLKKVFFKGYVIPEIEMMSTQEYIRDEKLDVGMRIDLLITSKVIPTLIYEIKSVNSKAFWWMAKEGWKPKEEHALQVHLYLHYLRKKYPNAEARLLYVSRDDLTVQELTIEYDEVIAKKAEEKFRLLSKCWKEKKVPPVEPAIVLNPQTNKYQVNWKAKYCSHHGLCLKDLNWEKKAEDEVAKLNGIQLKKIYKI